MQQAKTSRFKNYRGGETIGFYGSQNETLAYIDKNADGTVDATVRSNSTEKIRTYYDRKYAKAVAIVERHLKTEGYTMWNIPETVQDLPDRIIL